VNWVKVLLYAVLLTATGVPIYFIAGSSDSPGVRLFGGELLTFALNGAVFVHLGAHQPTRPYLHALLALLIPSGVGSLWLHSLGIPESPILLVAIDWLVILAALVCGTLVGTRILQRTNQHNAT
jgi:hypothetical protein